MPGTFVHVVEVVVIGVVTAAQSRQDAGLPLTDSVRVRPKAMPNGTSDDAMPTTINVRVRLFISTSFDG
jgi:hypothetical protein